MIGVFDLTFKMLIVAGTIYDIRAIELNTLNFPTIPSFCVGGGLGQNPKTFPTPNECAYTPGERLRRSRIVMLGNR